MPSPTAFVNVVPSISSKVIYIFSNVECACESFWNCRGQSQCKWYADLQQNYVFSGNGKKIPLEYFITFWPNRLEFLWKHLSKSPGSRSTYSLQKQFLDRRPPWAMVKSFLNTSELDQGNKSDVIQVWQSYVMHIYGRTSIRISETHPSAGVRRR